MTVPKQNRRLLIIALMLIMGAVFFAGTTAYAAAEPAANGLPPDTPLNVREVWLSGDTLHISVLDGGEGQTIELNLRDYAMPGDEYVTIQATDNSGRASNSITFKNPYYQQNTEPSITGNENPADSQSESAVPNGATPFTPDGTGSVLDNVTEANGKEFFSITTEDGNVFYLIVDRERNTDNVYLLNAVTENDLASLAKPGDGKSVSAVATPTQPPATAAQPEATPEPTPAPEPVKNNDNTGLLAFAGIAVLVIGGAAYYFKIVRPKKNGASADYDEPEDDFDDDKEFDVDNDEDGDDE